MKLMLFLNRQPGQSAEAFRQALLPVLQSLPDSVTRIRLALQDDEIAPAMPLAMLSTAHPKDAVLSLTFNDMVAEQSVIAGLRPLVASLCAYQVDEREPLHHDAPLGRVEGFCQVALIKKPTKMTREQWLDTWLNSHTQIAIDTQSTFSYRQNVVVRLFPLQGEGLYAGPLYYDAIVEEQFPSAAMTDRSVFFGAPGDTARYKANEKAMIDSVMRFIDFAAFECVPMSEYCLR